VKLTRPIQGILSFIHPYFRLNVNNAEYKQHQEKRERALHYWKDRVIQDFLPPIDHRKRDESLEKFIKMREDKSPNKLVSEIKGKNELKNKAQQIK
jgi:hypothetical protein